MSSEWQYQIRVTVNEEFAETARSDPDSPALAPLSAILARHGAALKCQYDAFADYVADAEREGTDGYPLYAWTKATIENEAKKARYLKSFTVYVGGREVYDKAEADALEAELGPLVGGGLVVGMAKHDTNPANNPQPPKQYRS